METQERQPEEENSLDENQNPKSEEAVERPEDAFGEISRDFSKYLRLRKIHGMIQSSIPVLIAFAIGLTIWLCAVGILWIAGTDYYSLAQSQLEMLPVIVLALILFLAISFFVGYKRFSRSRLDLNQYIHWCDIKQSFESELLTAFERKDIVVRSDFDEFIEKKAIGRIRETGVPQASTKADIKRFLGFACMLLLIAVVLILLYGIESKIDDSVSKFVLNDNAGKNDSVKDEKSPENPTTAENQNDKNVKNPTNDEPQNTDEKKNPKPDDPEKKKDQKNDDNGSENPENEIPKPENNDQKDESDKPENPDQSDKSENSKNDKPEDKAKFELDPKKVKPEASEDGESKTKKEKVYHLDKDNESEGSYVDPEKLLPNIQSSGDGVKSAPLTSQEKELIEKYRNKLEKNLSSR